MTEKLYKLTDDRAPGPGPKHWSNTFRGQFLFFYGVFRLEHNGRFNAAQKALRVVLGGKASLSKASVK